MSLKVELASFRKILEPYGQEVLQAAQRYEPRQADFLRCFQNLSKIYPPDLARDALEIAILRREAVRKFPFANCLYMNRQAFEQASAHLVSQHRAQRYYGFTRVIDLGCSIGADTWNLAEVAPAIGMDRDALRLAMAEANLAALGREGRADFIQADLSESLPVVGLPGWTGLFFDPARRTDERRFFSVETYQPPLSTLQAWLPRYPALGVKISPGVELAQIVEYDAEVEFISLRGELKEAVLWFGPLKHSARQATLLPGPHILKTGERRAEDHTPLPLREPGRYLYEPDAAVLRAGLVADLGMTLNAAQLDADIAYLTSDEWVETPFARVWQVEDWLPFQLKNLRAYLRQRGVGQVVVKKRGSPLSPEQLIHDLKLKGDRQAVLFLTHLRGRPVVVVGQEMAAPQKEAETPS